ncbi:hypothetical protein J2795_000100 [Chryseobacterium bernardetii]|uniref:Uncharacterized protein n=3 Tax=Chryseobacterium TaxID=59732 RepID=A0A543EP29_9FLAO|nr:MULTISPECIES: hypothetical protein [Chryseobacterium]MDR6369663.1 hypothetical protein [Chryseobacterium vietnamense]MDR6439415.1 hypothetical protein [Chryseobacterium bernardetii]MDR6458995.1 hypothetical protein [Chryseobacterium vietnamense]TQM23269.1 hypothetical protein FB551_3004 [Chryseobacterium aquifrigidense]
MSNSVPFHMAEHVLSLGNIFQGLLFLKKEDYLGKFFYKINNFLFDQQTRYRPLSNDNLFQHASEQKHQPNNSADDY